MEIEVRIFSFSIQMVILGTAAKCASSPTLETTGQWLTFYIVLSAYSLRMEILFYLFLPRLQSDCSIHVSSKKE
jgi:hypothetical protein